MEPFYKRFVNEQFDENGTLTSLTYNVPEHFDFAYDVLDELAAIKPDAPALLWRGADDERREFTFGDIKEWSDRAAQVFRSHGVKKGDRVMLILKRHYHFWFAVMGLHKIGAITVPATNQLQKKDLIYRFNAAEISTVVCIDEKEIVEHVEQAVAETDTVKLLLLSGKEKRSGWVNFEEELEKADGFVPLERSQRPENSDPLMLYFTSGTTGMPKMVAHDHMYPLAHIMTAKYWHNVRPGKLHLTVSETGWMKAIWGKLYGQWLLEAEIYAYDMERFNADELLRHIEKDKVCTFCAPPTIYRMMIQKDLSKYDLSCLEYATTAGEALNPEVFNKFKEATGLELMEGFGQTETTLTIATFVWSRPKPGSMGKPSPAYSIELIDANGNPVRDGVVGEIVLNTKNGKPIGMFEGYYKDDELTKTAWHDGYYHTGDMAWRDENGYFFYVSRIDDVIKSSGYRIGPFEVESVLMEHPAVVECAVTGVPDPVRGMAVKATIVLASGYTGSDELVKELQNYVKTHTAPYKYPRVVEFVDELPKTISGKIKRVDIRQNDMKND